MIKKKKKDIEMLAMENPVTNTETSWKALPKMQPSKRKTIRAGG